MKTDDFDFYLPDDLIAQHPILKRDTSRMMVMDRNTGVTCDKYFYDIVDEFNEGDVLVLNDTKVLPARLFGIKEDTNAHVEILLLKEIAGDNWECLVKPAKRVKMGTIISFGDGLLKAKCVGLGDEGIRKLEFIYDGVFYELLDKLGTMPLPPYIRERLDDQARYQTVYAKNVGSAAAPTAGLHFTEDILLRLKEKGVEICYVTLHVGLGTFRPVAVDDVTKHVMHSEYYMMSDDVARILNLAKLSGRRIVSVGTTSTRVLETVIKKYGIFKECSGWTDIFIYPGYSFGAIDGLITNFHLPKSTLIMLVSAFCKKEYVLDAYKDAVLKKYRFFSFGDCMFIR